MGQIITVSGEIKAIKPKNGKAFTLKEMQDVVEGYIEVTQTVEGKNMVVNEEGKLIGLPYNAKATSIHKYNDPIVGNVLVCDEGELV